MEGGKDGRKAGCVWEASGRPLTPGCLAASLAGGEGEGGRGREREGEGGRGRERQGGRGREREGEGGRGREREGEGGRGREGPR